MTGPILNKNFIITHEKIGCSKNLELHPLNFFAGAPSEAMHDRQQLLRTELNGRNELIPNVRKFAKKLQITIHSIETIKSEKQHKDKLLSN